MCQTFFSHLSFNAKNREIFYSIMDKENLIKLAQPAATSLLALSILAFPFISNAGYYDAGGQGNPFYVKLVN